MAYGTVKVDNITFTNGGIDQTITVSGIVQSISGNITATGTIQGETIIGTSTVSGATVTGDAGQFTTATAATGIFTSQISGATITGNVGSFTTITGGTVTLTSGVFASGTAAAPSVSIGTTDNGLYSPGADQVAVATDGSGRLFVDANGKVGVGVDAPEGRIHVFTGSSGATVNANADDLILESNGSLGISFLQPNTRNARIAFGDPENSQAGLIFYDHSADYLYFATAASERLRITSGGNVGIGTATPATTLHLSASNPQIRLEDSDGTNQYAQIYNSGGTSTFFSRNNTSYGPISLLQFNGTSSVAALYIDDSQRVGIGTTSPSQKLHITDGSLGATFGGLLFGDANERLRIGYKSGSPDTGLTCAQILSDTTQLTLASRDTSSGVIAFNVGTGVTEKARIDGSGRLLVGTSSALDVGTVGGANVVAQGASAGPAAFAAIRTDTSAGPASFTFGKSRSNAIVVTGDIVGRIEAAAHDGTDARTPLGSIEFTVDGTPGANDMPGRLVFSTTADGASSPTERLRITSAGLVGIGTSAPSTLLHVQSTADGEAFRIQRSGGTNLPILRINLTEATPDAEIEQTGAAAGALGFKTGATRRMTITSAGLVGIGASSISEQLQLGQNGSGTDNYIGIWGDQSGSNGEFAGLKFFNNQANASSTPAKQVASIYAARDSDNFGGALYFQTANPASGSQTLSTRMLLDSSGRLGIGTTSPGYPLDIQSNSSNAGLRIRGGSGGSSAIQFTDNILSAQWGVINTNASTLSVAHGSVVTFSTTSSERARIDSSGRLLVGTSTSAGNNLLQIKGDAAAATGVGSIFLQRGLSIATIGPAGNVDLAKIEFGNQDGAVGAVIQANVDATWSSNDYPSRLTFSTTADGASSPTERLRITSGGNVGIGTTSPNNTLQVDADSEYNIFAIQRKTSPTATFSLGINSAQTQTNINYQTDGLVFTRLGSEAMRLDGSRRLLVGTSSSLATQFSGEARVQVAGTGIYTLSQLQYSANAFGAVASFAKSRGASVGTHTVVQNGDAIGLLRFEGSDGTGFITAAQIQAEVDGTPGTGDMPGRLVFATTADGASSPTERLRITSAGNVGIGTTSPGAKLDVSGNIRLSAGNPNIEFNNGGPMVYLPAANTLAFATGGGPSSPSERARIDSSGRLLVGTSTAFNLSGGFGLGFYNCTVNGSGTFARFTNDANGPEFEFAKSRNTTQGSHTVVNGSDNLGAIKFAGSDGTAFRNAAQILCQVDGTPGANDMPGRLVFSTTADGASSPTERMRITNAGRIGFNKTPGAFENVSLGGTTTGNATQYGFLNSTTAASDVTTSQNGFTTNLSSAAASFTIANRRHFYVESDTKGAGCTIANAVGFGVSSGLVNATNNYGFLGNIASDTGRWNFYASGTAPNYFAGKIASLGSYNDTTASAANVFIASNGDIQRSTSSIRYKTDIETLEQSYADNVILNARPVWYRSLCEADNAGWSYYGLIAEEVAELDPRLVFWGRPTKEILQEEAKPPVFDDEGNEIEPAREAVYTNVEDTDAELRPEGVQYDRLTVMLIDVVQRQQKTIEELEARIAALEAN